MIWGREQRETAALTPPGHLKKAATFLSFPKEFDQAASRQVQQMFEEIDKELYEGRGAGAGILQGLQEECQQWATRFPHLRYWAQASATSTPSPAAVFTLRVCQGGGDSGGASR